MFTKEEGITDVIYQLRMKFKQMGYNAPETIVLRSHDDWDRLLYHLTREVQHTVKPVEGEAGEAYMEVTVFDIKVRVRADKWATPNGGYEYK